MTIVQSVQPCGASLCHTVCGEETMISVYSGLVLAASTEVTEGRYSFQHLTLMLMLIESTVYHIIMFVSKCHVLTWLGSYTWTMYFETELTVSS